LDSGPQALLVPDAGHPSQLVEHVSPVVETYLRNLGNAAGVLKLLGPQSIVELPGFPKLLKLPRIHDADL
jgi:hypothetical protein